MLPDSAVQGKSQNVPKGKLQLEYIAIGMTIIGGIITLVTYFENQKSKALAEYNAGLEKQIKELQLANLKKGKV